MVAPPLPLRTFAVSTFCFNSSAVTVQGSLFSGMSTAVVTPPAAMAAVPVSMPEEGAAGWGLVFATRGAGWVARAAPGP